MKLTVRVDGHAVDPASGDLIEVATGLYSVLHEEHVYELRVDGEQVTVNGRRLRVVIDDPRQFRHGANKGATEGRAVLRSTMPGKVVRILVQAGEIVEAGQGILIVEAMKMQNEVKSPRAGTVSEIKVTAEQTVAAGADLAVIE